MSPPQPTAVPVSIIGIGCRLPGADGPEEFWQLLLDCRDATGMPPPGRAGHRRGGYLAHIDRFDNEWFGISGREAALMDPQQRIALEVAVEALDDAGIGYRAQGSAGAVIFGACGFEHGGVVLGRGGYDPPYAVTGSASSIIANRLSYVLDLRGPSLVVDTACSSSLVAVDLAVRLLADGTVPFAVVGGVNLTLLPHTTDYLAEAGFLSPAGRCTPFDVAADGYVRGEGCAVVVLQRSADARREGNRVYAEIAGSAVGSDGRSNGLYAPNGQAQRDIIRAAWRRAGLTPDLLGYHECHGTGTALGDAVEVGALAEVRADTTRTTFIGSLKSNVGHLEAAAGVAGLIKAGLAVHHGTIPPTANFTSPNPLLRLGERGLRVPDEPVDWRAVPVNERYAGVSSFGFGGTNAHVALRGIARVQAPAPQPPMLIPLSGRDAGELRETAVRMAGMLDPRLDAGSTFDSDAGGPADTREASASAGGREVRHDPADEGPAGTRGTSVSAGGHKARHNPADEGPGTRGNSVSARGRQAQHRPADDMAKGSKADATAAVRADSPSPSVDPGVSLPVLAAGAARLLGETVRAAVIAGDRDEAVAGLSGLAAGTQGPRVIGPAPRRRPGGLLFLFSGQGAQHARMGRVLAARYPVFARTLTETADAIVEAGGPRVWTPRRGFGGNDGDATDVVQPALFAYQIALAALLNSFGVRPDGVAGHSLGEVAAAAVSGALDLVDAARVVVARSRALARLDGHGAMAVLEAEPDQVGLMVEPLRDSAGIAAVNGPRSVVVSGSKRSVETVVRRARRRGLFARRVAVEFAAHSPQVETVLPEFGAAIKDVVARVPQTPLYSTARAGRVLTTDATDVEYWLDNARGTVELAQAMEAAAAAGMSTVLEIGPHPQLIAAVLDHPDLDLAAHPATVRDDEAAGLLTCLAQLYAEGRTLDWSALGEFAGAPRRRWRRRRFPLVVGEAPGGVADLGEHVVAGVALIPAAYWLRRFTDLAHECGRAAIADLVVHQPAAAEATAEVVLRRESESVRAEAPGAGTLAKARLTDGPTPGDIIAWMRVVDANRAGRSGMRVLAATAFYAALGEHGLEYGPAFRPLRAIVSDRDRAIGTFAEDGLEHTATVDGCLQLLAAFDHATLPADSIPLPIAVGSAWLSSEPGRHIHEAHALLRTRTATGLVGDIIATDQHGAPALALIGVQIRFTHRSGGSVPAVPETTSGRSPARDRNPGIVEDPWQTGTRQFDPWQPMAPLTSARSQPGSLDPTDIADGTVLGAGFGAGAATVWWREVWEPFPIAGLLAESPRDAESAAGIRRTLVVGESEAAIRLTRELDRVLPSERVAREVEAAGPVVDAVLAGRTDAARTAVIVVWPAESEEPAAAPTGAIVDRIGLVLDLVQRVLRSPAAASLTVVLPVPPPAGRAVDPRAAGAVAGLLRSVQLESGRTVRLVWAGEAADPRLLARYLTDTSPALPTELRFLGGEPARRRFVPAHPRPLPTTIDPHGTYVVSGGLGALGSVAVRWLLDGGARDVVVPTRAPRPVPRLLDGLEDRIVVVRCDTADRSDLEHALRDIRECGSTIRGVVHAAGALEDALIEDVTTAQLDRMFAPKLAAATNLIELTAADPTDFVLLFSSATGAFGAPGQAAYACANAAMDALALCYPQRRITSIGWGMWDCGLSEAAGGAAHLRQAGIVPFDGRRGAELLGQAIGHQVPHLVALDYRPTADRSPVALRLAELMGPRRPEAVPGRAPRRDRAAEPLVPLIRRIVAHTLRLDAEQIDTTADFNDLGLSSLLAVDMRRALEHELGIRIATAELFGHPTVEALAAALADRIEPAAADPMT